MNVHTEMKQKSYLIIYILLLLCGFQAHGQKKSVSIQMRDLYDRILFTATDSEKIRLNDSILILVDGYTASDTLFSHKFTNLRFLGQITSSDQKVKILNWNLMLRDGTNKYFCYIIRKQKDGKPNQVIKLMGENLEEEIETDRSYTPADWYGALYYAIEPCRQDYMILGLDFGSRMTSRKIIDVLSFTDDGGILFGKGIFIKEKDVKFREVIEYSTESVLSLRFNSPKLIVFDEVDSFSSGDEGKVSKGAGLSFDGYIYKKGTWTYSAGIDARNPKK
jgi:hypothetical protein